jgi:DNA-binding MarR family transcriptional regulator
MVAMNQHHPETRWLDADEREAWLGLIGVTLLLPSLLDSQLQRDAGLTTFDYLVLAMLSEAPERTLQLKTLARLSNGSLSRLSHTVTRLEKRGWIRRETSPTDGRATVAVLTDAGYAKIVESAPGHVDLVRSKVFDALEPCDVTVLARAMRAVLNSIDPTWAPAPTA